MYRQRQYFQSNSNDATPIGIQAFKLLNTFLLQESHEHMIYYHIELDDKNQHLIASGIAVESYQD